MLLTCLETCCQHIFKHCVNMRGIVKKSQVELSVREGRREGGYLWGIEVLTHLKIYEASKDAFGFHDWKIFVKLFSCLILASVVWLF